MGLVQMSGSHGFRYETSRMALIHSSEYIPLKTVKYS